MDKYFNIYTCHSSYYMKIYDIKLGTRHKIQRIYNKLFAKIGIERYMQHILKLVVPYHYIYPSNINVEYYTPLYNRIEMSEEKYEIINNFLMKRKENLYYRLHTTGSLYFWELQYRYKLVNENTRNIYDINNVSSIRDACVLISDKYIPFVDSNYTHIIPSFMTNTNMLKNIQDKVNTRVSLVRNISIDTIFADTKQKFDDVLMNIKNIDILHINLKMSIFPSIARIYDFKYLMGLQLNLYTYAILCERINKGGSVCICISIFDMYYAPRIITIMAYMFEEYHFITPDTNYDKDEFIYVILKNKKDNISDYNNNIQHVINVINKNISQLNILTNYDDIQTIAQLIKNMDDKILCKIKLLNDDMIKLHKRIKKDAKECNKIFYQRIYKVYREATRIYKLDKKKLLTYKIIKEINDKHLYQCILWSKKYDMPIITIKEDYKIKNILTYEILKYMFSHEDEIKFVFAAYPTPEIIIDTSIDEHQMPKKIINYLTEYLSVTRALDNRDMDTYHKVKTEIDYYQKKLIKNIKKQYNIKDFVSQAWIKLFEIYSVIKIIPNSNESQTYKSFHFCELPGSMVYATMFYIKHKTKIKQWTWNAQSLNPNTKKTDDERVAFGDDGNILKKYRANYDFGPKDTGDINDPENLEYYQTYYGNNDLVTADCGLPYIQKNLSPLLAFSMFLSIFSVLKKTGSCIIKRTLPISDNQEIFLLYLTYTLFDQMIFYKPRVNQQSQEYYVIGIGYKGISTQQLEQMKHIQKNYKHNGLININTIPDTFLSQLDKACGILINNFNNFIRNKIYFADNYSDLTDDDWKVIKQVSKDKINEWIVLTGLDKI